MIRVFSKFENIPKNFMAIDTTSSGPFKDLSPFYVGPYFFNHPKTGLMSCRRMENLWQYTKVYPQYADQDGNPTPAFFQWMSDGFSNQRAVRYPIGKGVKPLYSWWGDYKLDYIMARKVIYIPHYAERVRYAGSFSKIRVILRNHDVALLDFDGYDHLSMGMTLKDVVHNTKKSMGHAFVLYGMLTGELQQMLG